MIVIQTSIFCLFLVVFSFRSFSQTIDFSSIGVESGLPSNEVYCVYEDRFGYIWAFTEYGIVRHNGVKFVPVCTNIPFSESAIYKVAETAAGEMLLVNSNARIYKVIKDKAILVKGMESLSAKIAKLDETILDVVDNGTGTYYISTHLASYCFYIHTGKSVQIAGNLPANEVNFRMIGDRLFTQPSFKEHRPGLVLKLTDQSGHLLHSFPVEITSQGRHGILRSGNNFCLMNRNELFLLMPDKSMKKQRFDNFVLNIKRAPNGHFWVAMAYDGLYELDADLNILHHYLEGLAVSDVLFDGQSGMWVSTIGNGIFYCSNIHHQSWNQIPELSGCISLLKITNGKLFVGTAGGNLYLVENSQMKKALTGDNKSYIQDIEFLGKRYYIGTKSSILEADQDFRKVIKAPVNYGGYAFAEGVNESLLILSGSLIFQKQSNSPDYQIIARSARPRHIVRRSETDYFISLRQGLSLWNGKLSNPLYLQEFRGKNVSMLSIDKNDNVWICTKGNGLYMLSSGNRIAHYQNLPSAVVSGICFAQNGTVLLATNKGVYLNTLNDLKNRGSWKLVQEGECTVVEEYQGKLYIATRHGLSILSMNEILSVPDSPFYFSGFMVNGKPLRRSNIRLTREQDDLFFQFDLLNYRFPSRQLLYSLSGPSAGRGNVNGTELHLQHLLPGHYELRVVPVINSVIREEKAILIPFYVAPAFYETGLFIGASIFLIVVIIVMLTSLISLRIRRKEAQRHGIVRLLAKYRLTALKAQVNPHFISNVLSAIHLLMLSGKTDKAGQYIAHFSLLIRYLLNYSDKAVASLESELKIIDLTVELEQLRFADRFEFRKETGETDLSKLFIPPLITQPFIENAIWHGLLPLKGKRTPLLLLSIRYENGNLLISITDNGVGRTNHTNRSAGQLSKGTVLMQNRMETLNFLHATNGAGITVTDLKDENGEARGTQVHIMFPAEMLNKLSNEQDQEHYY